MHDSDLTRLDRVRQSFEALGYPQPGSIGEAYARLRMTEGGSYATLLGTHIHKAELGVARGALNAIQYLSPATESGIARFTACPFASEGCAATCIRTTSQNVSRGAWRARVKRTLRWFLDLKWAARDLYGEVLMLEGRAIRDNLAPTARLDGTSDQMFWSKLPWWRGMTTQFYDYTKRPVTPSALRAVADGWHLTYSLSEDDRSMARSLAWAARGVNSATVVGGPRGSTQTIAKKVAKELIRRGEFAGRQTIDGDRDDLRWMDPAVGGWVVLSAKGGEVKHDETGFVVRFDPAVLLGTDWAPEQALLSMVDRIRFNPEYAAVAAK